MGEYDGFPLHEAADENLSDEDTVAKLEPLLAKGHNINETAGMLNVTPLIIAASRSKTAAVQLLLRHGADPNIQNVFGESALHAAARRGDAATVVALMHHGADPAVVDEDGETARDLAVKYGHGEVARLLEEGPKVKEFLDDLQNKNEENAKVLLDTITGKDVSLQYAILATKEEQVILAAVERLLEAGANTRFKLGGKTALDRALHKKIDKVVAALVKAGSDSEITDSLCNCAKVHDHEAVKLLLNNVRLIKSNWNINATDEEGFTALHHAVERDEGGEEATLAIVKLLLEQPGINTNVKNASERTALDIAVEKEKKSIVGFLVSAGGDLSSDDQLKKVLTMCVDLENKKAINKLMNKTKLNKKNIDVINDTVEKKENIIWLPEEIAKVLSAKVIEAMETFNTDIISLVLNSLDTKIQKQLFVKMKIHHEDNSTTGKSLLQSIAEKGDGMAKQKEDFITMLTKLEGEKDKIIADLKETMESSNYLVGWIQSTKNKFPISETKMWLEFFVAFILMVYHLGSYLLDVGTDGWVTHKFHKFSTLPDSAFSPVNITELNLQVIEQCKNSSQLNLVDFAHCYQNKFHTNHQFEHNQFSPEEWNLLYIISLVHMLLSWPWFWLVATYITKSHQTVFEVLLFPVSTYFEKFWEKVQLSRALQKNENETKKDKIDEKLKTLEKKEILVTTIEVSSESSFQFYIQTLIALPQFLISTVGAYKSKDSFRKEIVTWQNISILFSFLAMAKTFHKIRNLSKQNALSGKAAAVNFIMTTFETIARILAFGLYLYLYSENLDAMVAVGVYYGHILIMLFFNLVFNKEKPSCSVPYLLGLLFNSLNSVFTYTSFQYEKILENIKEAKELQNKSEKEKANPPKKEKSKLHQPSLARQVVFYSIILMENLALTISSVMFFDDKEKNEGSVHIADGFGGKIEMSRGNFQSTLILIWSFQFAAMLLRFCYYAIHPADVSIKDFKSKNQFYVFGTKYKFMKCQKKETCCCARWSCYVCCESKDNASDGETGDVESRISSGVDENLQDKASEGQNGGYEMDELATTNGDVEAGLIFNEVDENLEDSASDGQNGRYEMDELATTKGDVEAGLIFNEVDENLEDSASDGQNGRPEIDELVTMKGNLEAGLIFNEVEENLEDSASDGQNGGPEIDELATTKGDVELVLIFNEVDENLQDSASDGQNGGPEMDELATRKGDLEAELFRTGANEGMGNEDEDEIEDEVKLQVDSWQQFGDQAKEVFELSSLQLFKKRTWEEAKSYDPDTCDSAQVSHNGKLVMPGHDEEMAIQCMTIFAVDRYGFMEVRRKYTFIVRSQFIEPPSPPTDIKFMEEDEDMETSRAALKKEMENMSWDELASHRATFVTWEIVNL